MSVKKKLVTVAAMLALAVGGVGTAGTLTASAATPSCGQSCINLFNRMYGSSGEPTFVLDVQNQGAKVGQQITLAPASNRNPGEDFTIFSQGTVNDFFLTGLVSSAVEVHYSALQAYEFGYAPNGTGSGLCAGVAATATAREGVSLQPCDVSVKTVWIVDSSQTLTGSYVPLINGSDTNFTTPFVLQHPTGPPSGQLIVQTLQTSGQAVIPGELWSADFGALPHP